MAVGTVSNPEQGQDGDSSSHSASGAGSSQQSSSGSGSGGSFQQGGGPGSSGSGSNQQASGSGSGNGASDSGGGSYQHSSQCGSDQNQTTGSSSDTKQSSSSRTTGSSTVTWHETVSSKDDISDSVSPIPQRFCTIADDELQQEEDEEEEVAAVKPSDTNRSSLRRFKEGSKMYVGFLEDADGLQPHDDMLPPMSWEEKCEIIEELCAALEKRLDRLKNDKGDVIDGLQNLLDVSEHTIGIARKDRLDMHRNIIQFAELLNPSQKPYAEDMFRYLRARIIEKKSMKEKIQQRNQRLQKMVASAAEHLEAKVDIKDILHSSDIMDLKNLNVELVKQLDVRTHMLNKCRTSSRRNVKVAQTLGEDLRRKMQWKGSVKQSLVDRSPLIDKFDELITIEKREEEKLSLELLACVKGEDLRPTAMDYMKIKQRSKNLRRELYNWIAKVEIANLTYNQLTKNAAMLAAT